MESIGVGEFDGIISCEDPLLAWALHSQYLGYGSVQPDTVIAGAVPSNEGSNTVSDNNFESNEGELVTETVSRASIVRGIMRALKIVKHSAEIGIISLAISPANESARYAIFGWAHTVTNGNSALSSSAFGASTFIIEAVTALMAADLLDTHHGKKVVDKINDLSKRFIKGGEDKKEISLVARAATAMVFGSAVLTAAKFRKDTTRSKRKNQISGLKTAATMGLYFTAEGSLTSEAVNNFGWAKTIVGGVVALCGVQYCIKKIADKRSRSKNESDNLEGRNNE